jgi:hypothetical protein
MRALSALCALALFAGCSSSPSRPSSPAPASIAPLVIRWQAPSENTDGSSLTDIVRYDIEVTGQGQAPTRITQSPDTSEVRIPVPSKGTWTVKVTAVSASTGEGESAETQVER